MLHSIGLERFCLTLNSSIACDWRDVTFHSLLVTPWNSLAARCKITRYSLQKLLVAKNHSLQKWFVVKNHSLLVAKFDRYLLDKAINDTHREKTFTLLSSVQKFVEIQGWLLLTFFTCLNNQLSSFNSIIV